MKKNATKATKNALLTTLAVAGGISIAEALLALTKFVIGRTKEPAEDKGGNERLGSFVTILTKYTPQHIDVRNPVVNRTFNCSSSDPEEIAALMRAQIGEAFLIEATVDGGQIISYKPAMGVKVDNTAAEELID